MNAGRNFAIHSLAAALPHKPVKIPDNLYRFLCRIQRKIQPVIAVREDFPLKLPVEGQGNTVIDDIIAARTVRINRKLLSVAVCDPGKLSFGTAFSQGLFDTIGADHHGKPPIDTRAGHDFAVGTGVQKFPPFLPVTFQRKIKFTCPRFPEMHALPVPEVESAIQDDFLTGDIFCKISRALKISHQHAL